MFFYLDKNSPSGFHLRDTLKVLRWSLTLGYRLGLLGPGSCFSGMLLQAWKFIEERLQQYSCFPSHYEIFKGHLQTPASLDGLFQIGGHLDRWVRLSISVLDMRARHCWIYSAQRFLVGLGLGAVVCGLCAYNLCAFCGWAAFNIYL